MEVTLRKAQAKCQPHYPRLLALHGQLCSTLSAHTQRAWPLGDPQCSLLHPTLPLSSAR